MKRVLILIAVTLFAAQLHAQNGFTDKAEAKNLLVNGQRDGKWVIYFDSLWKETTRDNATYYRLTEFKDGKENSIRHDYYLSGQLQGVEEYINGEWQLSNEEDTSEDKNAGKEKNGILSRAIPSFLKRKDKDDPDTANVAIDTGTAIADNGKMKKEKNGLLSRAIPSFMKRIDKGDAVSDVPATSVPAPMLPGKGQPTLGIGMFTDVVENHPFSFDMYRFFKANPIKGRDGNNMKVKLAGHPGITDYYITGKISYTYTDLTQGGNKGDKITYQKNHNGLWDNNLYYFFECRLYKGTNLIKIYTDTFRKGVLDQEKGWYCLYWGAEHWGQTGTEADFSGKTPKGLFGVRIWPLTYVSSIIYREVYSLVNGNMPAEQLSPVNSVEETWQFKNSNYGVCWAIGDAARDALTLKWERKKGSYNDRQYINSLYDANDSDLKYNTSLSYPPRAEQKNGDEGWDDPTAYFPGTLINYVPYGAIIHDSLLLKEHYAPHPDFDTSTLDTLISCLSEYYENYKFGTKPENTKYLYNYKSYDRNYESFMNMMYGKHKRPGNCLTLLYIARKFAASGDYNASNLVYQQVILESGTMLSSRTVAERFKEYAYNGMIWNAGQQNHKEYKDLISIPNDILYSYLNSPIAKKADADYRKDISKLTGFISDMADEQKKINRQAWIGAAVGVAGAVAANAGSLSSASTSSDFSAALSNVTSTAGDNVNEVERQAAMKRASMEHTIALANIRGKTAVLANADELSADNSYAAQEVLYWLQLYPKSQMIMDALRKYSSDKPILRGLLSDYKNSTDDNARSTLIALCKQLKKIEKTICKYELTGVQIPADVIF